MDEQIDRLTDSYVSDRLIAKKRWEVSALIAQSHSTTMKERTIRTGWPLKH